MKRILWFAPGRRRRTIALATAPLVAATLLSGCGGSGGPPTLTWYINPDNGGAGHPGAAVRGRLRRRLQVDIQTLPANATGQREQLVRRLAARDSSIDLDEPRRRVHRRVRQRRIPAARSPPTGRRA